MKLSPHLLSLCTCLGLSITAGAAVGPIPNGKFDTPAGSAGAWLPVSGGGTFNYDYPTTGGNPGGFGIINNPGGTGFGIWVANNGNPISLSSIGLTAGKAYTFQVDMKIISGTRIGGFKIDFFADANQIASTGDLYPVSGTADWVTYSFPITINAGADGIKVVPLWGPNSSVGFDNISIQQPDAFAATIAAGTVVSWNASNGNTYQPQESENNVDWTDLGPVVSGAITLTRLDPTPAAFYQVVEVIPGGAINEVPNPGFEDAGGNSLGAANWNIAVNPNTGASMTIENSYAAINPHGGARMLKIESITPASGPVAAPNTDVRSTPFSVNAGTTYDLSFYAAHPVKVGGANPQYSVFFYNASNGVVGGPIFTSFASVGSAWTKISTTVTPPAGTTKLTIGWIQAMGAANNWNWVTLIDDVSLSTGPAGPDTTNFLSASAQPGVEVRWNSLSGTNYQVQTSTDLGGWTDYGLPLPGNGNSIAATDLIDEPRKFYQVREIP